MPFLPLILYDVGLRFSAGAVRMCGPDRPIWRLVAYSALASCFMIATQTAGRIIQARGTAQHPSVARQSEIRRVLSAHLESTILTGAGGDQTMALAFFRHELVFAGHAIGIDIASAMDYRKAGLPQPNLTKLTAELWERHHRPVLWLIPHGEPFSLNSVYTGQPALLRFLSAGFSCRLRAAGTDRIL